MLGEWLTEHWFTLLQSTGIIASLLFTAASFRIDVKERRLSHIQAITSHHRELWTQLHQSPELARILDADADINERPVSTIEEQFTVLIILHLNSSFRAISERLYRAPDHLQEDIRQFFSLPVPMTVWHRVKPMQDRDFVDFVERALVEVATAQATRLTGERI